jgi:hypothetical protein
LYVGKNAVISGWGEAETFLKAMSLDVISQKDCKPVFGKSGINITKDHLCLFRQNEAGNHGDSGGNFIKLDILKPATLLFEIILLNGHQFSESRKA